MITQLVLDGSEITAALDSIVSALVSALLAIMSGFFEVFFEWFVSILGGTFLDNPAPFLIGILFMLTAWKVHTSG